MRAVRGETEAERRSEASVVVRLGPRSTPDEPLPDYRHCCGPYYRGRDGLPFSLARHFIVDRRSTPRSMDGENTILQSGEWKGRLRR